MIDINNLKEHALANNGILKTADLQALGFHYRKLQTLLQNGTMEKIRQCYYRLSVNDSENETILIARLFPDGVLCMYTALFYYGYSDRTPLQWDIAIDKNTSKSCFKMDYPYVQPYYLEPEQLSYGVVEADYPDCTMRIFDRDRLICECLRYEAKMDRETFNKAIQGYVADTQRRIPKLLEYAKRRRVEMKVRAWIGVWL